MSLAGLLIVPFLFNYGGGAAHPEVFWGILFYLFCGFVTAIYLYFRSLAARILALVWHSVFVGCVFWLWTKPDAKPTHGLKSVLTFSALAIVYLAATSLPKIYSAVQKNPSGTRNLILGGFAVALIFAGRHAFFYSTDAGPEMRLHSSDNDTRCAAAKELASKGPAAKSALPTLEAMMDTTICFGDNGPLSKFIGEIGGIEPLIHVVNNGGPSARVNAIWQLRASVLRYPEKSDELKNVFAAGLRSEDSSIRKASVEAMGDLGPKAEDLLPQLQKLIDDPSPDVQGEVKVAIAKINNPGRPF